MYFSWMLFGFACGESEPEKIEEVVVEDTACTPQVWFLDSDGDGFGTPLDTIESCDALDEYVDNSDDCNDSDSFEMPGQTWHLDADDDGFGDAVNSVVNCQRPIGYVLDATDCDDQDDTRNASVFWYSDSDGDGFGDPDFPVDSCTADSSASPSDQDCDDSNAFIRPNVNEICDEVDNNCDGLIDDADPNVDSFTQEPLYLDADGDGYGFEYLRLACATLDNESFLTDDCDDADPNVHPHNLEMTDDSDQNCDGETFHHIASELQHGLVLESLSVSRKSIKFEDMTGDGSPDLVVYNTQTMNATVTIAIEVNGYDKSIYQGTTLEWTDPVSDTHFGNEVVSVQDLNSDGLNDWLVSAPGTNNEKVYLLNEQSPPLDQGVWYWDTPNEGSDFGISMLSLGDIDGDGFIETAVGATKNHEGGTRSGAVFLLDEATLQAGESVPQISRLGPSAYVNFGKEIDNVGDLDGDGIDEILVLASGMIGAVHVFEPDQLFDSAFVLESATRFIGSSNGSLGYATVNAVGDFNGDGYKDFAVSSGSLGFLMNFGSSNLPQENLLEDAPLQYTHSNGNNLFARSVLRDVDLDGDGFDELVFSNPGEDQQGTVTNHGIVQGFWGGTQTGVYDDTDSADFVLKGGGGPVHFFGYGLASGDVDHDGRTDIWVAGSGTTVSLLLGKYIQ